MNVNEVSLVVLAHDRVDRLGPCVAALRHRLDDLEVRGEVIVADHGSAEGSRSVAIEAGARVVHIAISGYGAAVRGALVAATGRFVVVIDDAEDLPELGAVLDRLRAGAQLVIGLRASSASVVERAGASVARSAIGSHVHDVGCGVRAMDRAVALSLDLRTTGDELATEMVVQAVRRGVRIDEVALSPRRSSVAASLPVVAAVGSWLAWSLAALALVVAGIAAVLFAESVGTMTLGGIAVVGGVELAAVPVLGRAIAATSGLRPRRTPAATLRLLWSVAIGMAVVVGGTAIVAGVLRDANDLETAKLIVLGGSVLLAGLGSLPIRFLLAVAEVRVDPLPMRIHEVSVLDGRPAARTVA